MSNYYSHLIIGKIKMYKKNYFNFKKFYNDYLLTNDLGKYTFINKKDFISLVHNEKVSKKAMLELECNQFVYENEKETFIDYTSQMLKKYKSYLDTSTVLHIFVVSKTCNYNCIYCQAGNLNYKDEYFMTEETAKKAVDIAFESPSKILNFEFQGGEPLTNFKIIKYIVEYSKEKNNLVHANEKKEIIYNIVSNLSLLNDEIIDFIKANDIYVCTSIDGDKELQNKNRPFKNGDSYDATINSLKRLQENKINASALVTTTKYSLNKSKEIVDEYVKLGIDRICIRPLTNLGKAYQNWKDISYTAEEFVEFYKQTLKYIIELNKKGIYLQEGMASIFLSKILNNDDVNYMELRSPCGAAIGQMAYYYDGNIYTCDEARMLAEMGDNKFLLGNVHSNKYKDLIKNSCTEEVCKASCLECSAICHSCVYMPYCGTCPILNYAQTGNINLQSKNDFKCKINKGILDTLFSYIKNDRKALKIFYSWI